MRRLIGVDWSAESFRAWHVDARGVVTDRRESGDGLRRAARRGHEKTLRRHVGGWLGPDATLIVSGAVFDRRGWIETPLPSVPAGIDALLDNAVHRWLDETPVLVLPGLANRAPGADDVMRREALLALGAVRDVAERDGGRDGRRLIVVPGTRSRWIRIADARVTAFRTAIGGELLALLLDGAFGKTLPPGGGANDEPAFLDGVARGYRSRHPITDLFASRAAVLIDERDADLARAELRGRVIGNEIREAEVALEATGEALTLIGDDATCEPYARALRHLGTTVARVGLETAARAGLAALGARLPSAPPRSATDRATADVAVVATAPELRTEPLDTPPTPSSSASERRGFDDAFAELPLLAFLPAVDPRGVVGAATTMAEAGFRILLVSMRDESANGSAGDATDTGADAGALATIRRLSDAFGTRLCIGVRDVPTPKAALAAIDAGARVVVASGTDEAIARRCAKRDVPWVPGVATVTEANAALALGARALLLYPAALIEPRVAQAFRRALPPGTPLLPAGGLTVRTLPPHAAAGASGAVADDVLARPGANRAEHVAAARTFVRTWRRIERGRRALAAETGPRTTAEADEAFATSSASAPERSPASASRGPGPRASLATSATLAGPPPGSVRADDSPNEGRPDDASARTPTPPGERS